ncbi:MAG: transketolase [Desulfovibrio sp.]|nr:transketolase [Desulfovibrio sp.]
MTEEARKCKNIASGMRADLLRMALKAGSGGAHIGGALSATDIIAALYGAILDYDREDWNLRDRFIFSKGHCVMAQYAAMKETGRASEEELASFEDADSWLCSHATMNREKGIEFSAGSLGQGLSLGVGVALALRKKGNTTSRIIVLTGDGECQEGQIWEAAMSGAQFNLHRLVVIVDANGMQVDGRCDDIMCHRDLRAKWEAFGWKAVEIDGHNIGAVIEELRAPTDRPLAIVARTVKGKGVSFMENSVAWHHGRLGKKQFEQAMAELEAARDD